MPKLGIGLRYIFLTAFVFASLVGFWLSGSGQTITYKESGDISNNKPHLYDDPARLTDTVHIMVYYFVPRNKTPSLPEKWPESLKVSLEKIVRFHKSSFLGRSVLSYDIVAEPIIGENDSLFYDTNDTNRGNPAALRSISAELKRRLPATAPQAAREAIYIIYEGVGAAGGDDTALLSSKYLTGEEYAQIKETLIAHEFYHTLGFPDGYREDGTSFQNDIMGNGRDRSLSLTFILPESLRHIGL